MTSLTREALFDLVWTEPMTAIARRLGVSDVWVRKCCVRAAVSMPERGHWAKARAGKPVCRPTLPLRPPGVPMEVAVGDEGPRYRSPLAPEIELAEPPPVEPMFAEPIESVAARVDKSLGKVRLLRDFSATHPLIRHVLDEDELRRLKPADAPYRLRNSDPLFDPPVERRRLRILNSLFQALAAAAHRPWIEDSEARKIGVIVGVQHISFTLDPPGIKPLPNGQVRLVHDPYALLRLAIPATGDAWTDEGTERVEDRLREIVAALILAGEVQYRAIARRVYDYACSRRVELEQIVAKRRAEAIKLAHENALKAEAARRNSLLQMAADHRSAEDIRTFVRAAVAALRINDTTDAITAWSAWALTIADRTDPLRRLRVTDGTVVLEPQEPLPEGELSP